ncbi:hypothetical protein, partial [Paraburkholderia sp. UYCP14C]|uniref:hypothetical protein n=1 Tax=Paraburkholderia sp. UYCP14C TaxID=2511130 RepID=UPI001B7D5500
SPAPKAIPGGARRQIRPLRKTRNQLMHMIVKGQLNDGGPTARSYCERTFGICSDNSPSAAGAAK